MKFLNIEEGFGYKMYMKKGESLAIQYQFEQRLGQATAS
jgi:hypothetical protein